MLAASTRAWRRADAVRVRAWRRPPRYPTGGIDSFVKLGGSSKHQDFFTSAAIKQLYKQHITFMANRVNSINGRKYSEDPTIMAWCARARRPLG